MRMGWAISHVNGGVLFNGKELLIYSGFFDPLATTNLCHYHQGCHFVLMHGGELRVYLIPWGLAIKLYCRLSFKQDASVPVILGCDC